MTSTKPIFSTFLGNAETWQKKWNDFEAKPIKFGRENYVSELTPFYGLPQFEKFSDTEKEKLFFEYVKLVGEAQILLEQILIYGFFHYRKKRQVYDDEVNESMDKLSLEELYHSQAFRDFLAGVPELEWKEKRIYPKGSLLRKAFAFLIKRAPLGMTLPGAKIEAFSLAYYKLLRKHYPHELDNSWIELSYYHHQDEAFHVPLEFDIYNSTIMRSGAIKTLIGTLLFISLLQWALLSASWRLIKHSFPNKSTFERIVLVRYFVKWAIRHMPAFEETRAHTKKLFKKKKPLFSNILSFMHW